MHKRVLGVITGLAAVATMATAPTASADAGPVKITMPALSGRYPVGTIDLHLVDKARQDPWKPAQRREVMATVSYPADRAGTGRRASWLEPGVANAVDALAASPDLLGIPRGSVDWGSTRRQARTAAGIDRSHGDWPVVLFSPGFGGARELNAGLVDDLASRGYVVVSLSHTHESVAVEFPDGRVEPSMIDENDPTMMKTAIDARTGDARLVLDELPKLDRRLAGALDLSKIGMFGHSYGGYTAGETMVQDRRIDAGINLDGAMRDIGPGEIVKHGVDRPFLLMGADFIDPATGTKIEHSHQDRVLDPTWADFWPNQRAWKRDLHLHGSTHYSYTDLQIAVPQMGALLTPAQQAGAVGPIDPTKSLKAQHDYVSAYFDLHLKGRDRHLFDGNSPNYPEVRFID
jgi:dienelactone hydrolase